jgi:hypothetical protein
MIRKILLSSVAFCCFSLPAFSENYTYDGTLTQNDIDQSILYGSPQDPSYLEEDKTYMDQIINDQDWSATTGCLDVLPDGRTWNGTEGGQCANSGLDKGTFTFGYGQTVLAQTQSAINEALKIAGISVAGYRWQWKVKNADTNYEDTNGAIGQDPLYIRITVKDKEGNVLDEREWDYSYHIDGWEQKYGMHWYDPFINGDDIDTITTEIEAYDAGYWAGWYGPEVGEVGVYSIFVYEAPDPCEQIPIVDPTCPGFIGEAPTEDPVVASPLVIIESTGSIPLSEDELSVLESLEESPAEVTNLETVLSEPEPVTVEEIDDVTGTSVDALGVAKGAEAAALAAAGSIIDNTLNATAESLEQATAQSQSIAQQSQEQSEQSQQEALSSAGFSPDGTISVDNKLNQGNNGFSTINIEIEIDSFEIAALSTALDDAVMNLLSLEGIVLAKQDENRKEKEKLAEQLSNEKEDELVTAALAGDNSEDAQAALLGYNPNFRAYQQTQIPDSQFYQPKEIYEGQKNYDNPNSRFFNGASDELHNQMVRQQYER